MAADREKSVVLHHWSARKLHPIIVVYVAAVFLACMAVSYFLVHSMTAVKALAIAAVAAVFPLFPSVINKVEYQLTESGLEKRPLNRRTPQEFKSVFLWDQLSHVIPMKHGFKFYKPMNDSNPFRRFWKAHISDAFSGEFHVEVGDRDKVLSIMEHHGIPTSKS